MTACLRKSIKWSSFPVKETFFLKKTFLLESLSLEFSRRQLKPEYHSNLWRRYVLSRIWRIWCRCWKPSMEESNNIWCKFVSHSNGKPGAPDNYSSPETSLPRLWFAKSLYLNLNIWKKANDVAMLAQNWLLLHPYRSTTHRYMLQKILNYKQLISVTKHFQSLIKLYSFYSTRRVSELNRRR